MIDSMMPLSFWIRRAVGRVIARTEERAADFTSAFRAAMVTPAPPPDSLEQLRTERDEMAPIIDAAVDLVNSLPRCWHDDCARHATCSSTYFQDTRCDDCYADGDELEYAPALRVLLDRLTASGYMPPPERCSRCRKAFGSSPT